MLKSCLYYTFSFLLPLPYAAAPDDPQIRGCSVLLTPWPHRDPADQKDCRKAAAMDEKPAENERNEAKKTGWPPKKPARSRHLQDLSSFLMESGRTKRGN